MGVSGLFFKEINNLICPDVKREHWGKALVSPVQEGPYVFSKKSKIGQGWKTTWQNSEHYANFGSKYL